MSKNVIDEQLANRLIKKIAELERQVADLKTNQLKRLVLPKYSGTPTGVVDGEIWYDTSSNKAKKREGGVTKDFNTA